MADPAAPHIMIVESRFYEDVADELLKGANGVLEAAGASFERVSVPGAFEIPAAIHMGLRSMEFYAARRRFDGYVALGNAYGGEIMRSAADTGYIDIDTVTESYAEIVAVLKANPLVELPPEIMMVGRVFGLLSGLSKHLDAHTNMPEIFQQYLDNGDG